VSRLSDSSTVHEGIAWWGGGAGGGRVSEGWNMVTTAYSARILLLLLFSFLCLALNFLFCIAHHNHLELISTVHMVEKDSFNENWIYCLTYQLNFSKGTMLTHQAFRVCKCVLVFPIMLLATNRKTPVGLFLTFCLPPKVQSSKYMLHTQGNLLPKIMKIESLNCISNLKTVAKITSWIKYLLVDYGLS